MTRRSRRSSLLGKEYRFDGKHFYHDHSSVGDENEECVNGNTNTKGNTNSSASEPDEGQNKPKESSRVASFLVPFLEGSVVEDCCDSDVDDHLSDLSPKDDDDKYAKYQEQQRQRSFFRRILRGGVIFQHLGGALLAHHKVDAVLSASGCAGSLAALQWLSRATGRPVFGPFLTPSAITFFFNESPPSLTAFLRASLFGSLAGTLLHFVPGICGEYAPQALLFVSLLSTKFGGSLWPASNALTMAVAVESGGWGALAPSVAATGSGGTFFPWHFLLFPYISGHLLLFGMAVLLSALRRRIRTALIQREVVKYVKRDAWGAVEGVEGWRAHIVSGLERRDRLRVLFNKADSNRDGHLEATELQAALAAITGKAISLRDTRDILNSADSSGYGNLNFDDFCASINKFWPE